MEETLSELDACIGVGLLYRGEGECLPLPEPCPDEHTFTFSTNAAGSDVWGCLALRPIIDAVPGDPVPDEEENAAPCVISGAGPYLPSLPPIFQRRKVIGQCTSYEISRFAVSSCEYKNAVGEAPRTLGRNAQYVCPSVVCDPNDGDTCS